MFSAPSKGGYPLPFTGGGAPPAECLPFYPGRLRHYSSRGGTGGSPGKVRILADQRWQAKQNRDWTEADRLRAEVAALGWVIKDRKDGYDLARK
ncbi:hypothetical protein M5E88_09505 [Akkermansia muciniphila]|nr:hypothetical protein M5E88_09505 [Akkermansia muciniphila]